MKTEEEISNSINDSVEINAAKMSAEKIRQVQIFKTSSTYV